MNHIRTVISHVPHVLGWRVREVKPSDAETDKLNEAEIPEDDVYRSYILWRRWMLWASIPSIGCSAVASIEPIRDLFVEEGLLSPFGKVADLMPLLSPFILTIAAFSSLLCWKRKGRSTWLLLVGWIISMVLPLWPALVPVHIVVGENAGYAARVNVGVSYSIQILPLIITFPSGAVRGGLRIRGLLPESALAGWIIVVGAPFHSLMNIMALVFMVQVFGTYLLVIGAVILVTVPFIYIFKRKVYTQALTKEHEEHLDNTQRFVGLLSIIGFVFILAWAFTVNVEGYRLIGPSDEVALLPYSTGVRLVFEWIGRMFITTLCYADIILNMTLANWRADLHRHSDGDNIDVMDSLQQAFLKAASKEIETEAIPESAV